MRVQARKPADLQRLDISQNTGRTWQFKGVLFILFILFKLFKRVILFKLFKIFALFVLSQLR